MYDVHIRGDIRAHQYHLTRVVRPECESGDDIMFNTEF